MYIKKIKFKGKLKILKQGLNGILGSFELVGNWQRLITILKHLDSNYDMNVKKLL